MSVWAGDLASLGFGCRNRETSVAAALRLALTVNLMALRVNDGCAIARKNTDSPNLSPFTFHLPQFTENHPRTPLIDAHLSKCFLLRLHPSCYLLALAGMPCRFWKIRRSIPV